MNACTNQCGKHAQHGGLYNNQSNTVTFTKVAIILRSRRRTQYFGRDSSKEKDEAPLLAVWNYCFVSVAPRYDIIEQSLLMLFIMCEHMK